MRVKGTLEGREPRDVKEQRRQPQAELARGKNEETARRLAGGGSATGDGVCGSVPDSSDLIAYKNVNDVPFTKELVIQIDQRNEELVIQVDQRNEAILLPIYGSMVPEASVCKVALISHQSSPGENGS